MISVPASHDDLEKVAVFLSTGRVLADEHQTLSETLADCFHLLGIRSEFFFCQCKNMGMFAIILFNRISDMKLVIKLGFNHAYMQSFHAVLDVKKIGHCEFCGFQ